MDHFQRQKELENLLKRTNQGPRKTLHNCLRNWTCEDACLTVVDDGHKNFVERELLNSVGLAVVQQQSKLGRCVIK